MKLYALLCLKKYIVNSSVSVNFLVDDEPDDEGSPHHYVLIQGILTASVISNLIEVGVNVDALICLKAENYDSLTPTTHQKDENTAAKVS